ADEGEEQVAAGARSPQTKDKAQKSLRAKPRSPTNAPTTHATNPPQTHPGSRVRVYAPPGGFGRPPTDRSPGGNRGRTEDVRIPAPYSTIHRTVIPTTVLLVIPPTATPMATTAASKADMVTTAARHPLNDRSSSNSKWNPLSMTVARNANVTTTTTVRACHLA